MGSEGPAHYYSAGDGWRPTPKGWWRLPVVIVIAAIAALGVYFLTR